MEVVSGSTLSLLSKLGGFLQEEYKLQGKVKKDIESLQKELIFMNATLLMVADVPADRIHPLVSTWATLIRELSYDMEDVVTTFVAESHGNGPDDLGGLKGLYMKASNMVCMGTSHHRIAAMIEEMKSLTKELTELRDRYLINNMYIGPTTESQLAGENPGNGNSSSSEAIVKFLVASRQQKPVGAVTTKKNSSGGIAEHLIISRQLIQTEKPVGIDMQKLGDWLKKHNDSPKHRSVLSIVGFGGVGKTTIASALYREFRNQFECGASVTVSQIYDEDQVLRDIIGQIKPQSSKNEQQKIGVENRHLAANIAASVKQLVMPLIRCQKQHGSSGRTQTKIEATIRDQLIKELKGHMIGKRYLILIDDIWSAETWENIRNWLPHDNTQNSRVIVTTRFQAVGAACSERETDLLHAVDVLNDVNSKSLFLHCVSKPHSSKTSEPVDMTSQDHEDIAQTHSVPESHGTIGRKKEEVHNEMWEYCGGLPLALVTMAGLVGCNPNKTNDDWGKVCKSLFPEQVAPLTLEGVTRILDYCYNDLPADLKTCTLYLSIFPKGSKIYRKRLTRRWISECFVIEKQGLTSDEVAETFFNQLISRKIIHAVDHNSNGKIKSFKVHDMILEYILSKSSEENFITVVGGHWLMPAPSNKVRRLSMQSSGSTNESSTQGMNLSHVRSLTACGSMNQQLPFHSFNNGIIKVLDLEGWKGLEKKHLSDICKMVVLEYLSLRRTEISEIPSQIDKLEHLETLDIRETNVAALPKSFGRLKLLRTMLGGSKNPRKTLKLPQGTNNEQMKGLRILSGIEITEESVAVVASLRQLTGLKKLAIYKLHIEEGGKTSKQLRSSIEYLCSCGLQTLAINDEGYDFINSLDSMSAPPRYLIGLELSGKMERAPKWIGDLNNLYKLTLSVTVLQTSTFVLIRELPKLFSLTFTLNAAKDDRDIVDILEENKQLTEREIIVPPGGFKSLKLLRFFATLVHGLSFAVRKEEQVMPALERIDMRFQSFEGIYGIETLESLKEVYLSVDTRAGEITKFLVDDLKDAHKQYKWLKIITG